MKVSTLRESYTENFFLLLVFGSVCSLGLPAGISAHFFYIFSITHYAKTVQDRAMKVSTLRESYAENLFLLLVFGSVCSVGLPAGMYMVLICGRSKIAQAHRWALPQRVS